MNRLSLWGVKVQNASILLYLLWLLLPAVQTTGRAASGVFCVALFGLGVLMDAQYLKTVWPRLLLRALCAAAAPLVLRRFLNRGGDNFWGYYVQQAMFWFPLVFAGHVRQRRDARAWRWMKWVLLAAVTVTTLTTIGWLIQGMLRGGKVYAYSRSLGYGGEGRDAYLKELMLRNIGGYDFIYASVAALPLTCIGIMRSRGWARTGYTALLCAQTVMIALSQYTYALVFAAAILAAEALAALARCLSRGKLKLGGSLLIGLVPLLLALALRKPLIGLGAGLCSRLGLDHFAFSLEQLQAAMEGGVRSADSRMSYYLTALEGFRRSPLVGRLLGGEALLSQHSDLLDLLSGLGLLGTALFGAMMFAMGRGALQGVCRSPERAQLCVMAISLLATAALGTVCYSRDIMAVAALGTLLVLEGTRRANPPG